MQIAIFDVCDTIYKTNTTFKFLDYYLVNDKKYIFFRKITKLFPVKVLNFFLYKVFKKDLMRYFGTLFLRGKEIEEVQKYTHKFVYTNLVSDIKDSTVEMMNVYKDKGYKIVLMSGSYLFIIKEVAKYFNIDFFYASKLKIVNRFYTGKYDRDILLSKYELLKKEFKNFDKLVVVSNNKTDLELMQFADQSFAICNKEDDLKFWKPYVNISCIKDY